MRRSMMAAVGLAALGGAGALAQAQPVHPLDPAGLDLPAPRADGATRDASDDIFGTAITIHSASGHAFLDSAPDVHIFGSTAFAGLNSLDSVPVLVTTSETTLAPHTTLFVIEWAMSDGSALIPSGATLDNEVITGMGFHVGEGSAPAQLITWEPNPGFSILETTFELFDLTGADLLDGHGVFDAHTNGGAGLSGSAFVGADDLGILGATRARATVTVQEVPAPGGAGMLVSLAALATRRRRRR
ncbi:MAG: hypothetical protein R3B57_08645 [Phycisphaerales bacterium]